MGEVDSAAWMLRRLLILNSYGFTVEHHEAPKPLDSGEPFLSDEWIEKWYGKDGLPDFVWEELRRAEA